MFWSFIVMCFTVVFSQVACFKSLLFYPIDFYAVYPLMDYRFL